MKLYDLELDANKRPILVEEKTFRYSSRCNTPKLIKEMLNTCFNLCNKAEEHVYLIALNTKLNVSGVFLISKGTINASICNPREILQRCFIVGASAFVIAHNHPSGDCSPSREDVETYNKLKEAGNIMGIQCLDSIILSNSDYYSLSEN